MNIIQATQLSNGIFVITYEEEREKMNSLLKLMLNFKSVILEAVDSSLRITYNQYSQIK